MEPITNIARTPAYGAATDGADREAAYQRARRKVRLLRGWYLHAFVYACVIAVLWAVYLTLSPARFPWPLPATLGWGLGLGIHGLVVWLATSRRGREWEARKIEQYLKDEQGGPGGIR